MLQLNQCKVDKFLLPGPAEHMLTCRNTNTLARSPTYAKHIGVTRCYKIFLPLSFGGRITGDSIWQTAKAQSKQTIRIFQSNEECSTHFIGSFWLSRGSSTFLCLWCVVGECNVPRDRQSHWHRTKSSIAQSSKWKEWNELGTGETERETKEIQEMNKLVVDLVEIYQLRKT